MLPGPEGLRNAIALMTRVVLRFRYPTLARERRATAYKNAKIRGSCN
jgi:hypothetical protein